MQTLSFKLSDVNSNNQNLFSSITNGIVFIDPKVDDYQTLRAGVTQGLEVVLLDEHCDGISQITEALKGRRGLLSLHIVAHGEAGLLWIGKDFVNSNTLENYKDDLPCWRASLAPDADILLYGCKVAEGKKGKQFVEKLAKLTGANIAASSNLKGSAQLGGDWELEVKIGKVETPLAFGVETMQAYNAVLAINYQWDGTALNDSYEYIGSDNLLAYGYAGNDTITGSIGNDTIDGGLGIDSMTGGTGNDSYYVDSTGDVVTENLNEGTDTVYSSITYILGDNLENLTLTGTSAIAATGNALNNVIIGNSGNNTLYGGTGADTLDGGDGDDYLFGGGSSGVYDTSNESLSGGNGNDTVIGGTGADTLDGGDGNDYLFGHNGNDSLNGGAGNDTLHGGVGDDTMAGGVGDDNYYVDNAADVVTENLNEGTDTVNSSITYTLGANLENLTLTGTSAINGTGNALNNKLTGNSANNVLTGAAGNDTLDGGLGNDAMAGGVGDDNYYVDSAADVVTENLNEGTDTVNSSITYTLGANLENLTLTGTSAIAATGNALNNKLTGNSGNNVLTGAAGNDTLDGGLGNDAMTGGVGNDSYYVDSAADVVTENLNEGTDTVNSSITYTLGDNLENLTLTGTSAINGTGNAFNNVITGNSGNNTLDGGLGIDTMGGDLGDDSYYVDSTSDVVKENLNEGIDTVFSSISYTLAANVENLTLTGSNNINATGNNLNNVITGNSGNNSLYAGLGADILFGEDGNDYLYGYASSDTSEKVLFGGNGNDTLVGSIGADSLSGDNGNDLIYGYDGNDILDGGLGNDTMYGSTGNDSYKVDSTSDIVTEYSNEGIDTVFSSITYTLGANVENLTLTGSSAINGSGNTLNNVIIGNSGNNTLSGGTGDDTLDGSTGSDSMLGGAGNDIYYVDIASDKVTENLNEGIDTVYSGVSYGLGANLENLTLIGSAIQGAGNILDNIIYGNAQNNGLSGQAGNDNIYGGAGNDKINGNAGDDSLYGEDGNDFLTGELGNDLLSGGSGDDILVGYGGAIGEIDILLGGLGADTFGVGVNFARYGGSGGLVGYTGDGYDGYAFIEDWDSTDTIELKGDLSQYTILQEDWALGTATLETSIYYNGTDGFDLIGIVQDTGDASLNLSFFT
ncbi:MAG: DUF4347 domain-containing protein [Potamolinea sp.]